VFKKVSLALALAAMVAACGSSASPAPSASTAAATSPTAAAASASAVASAVESQATTSAPANLNKKVGYSTPTAASGFMAFLSGELEKRFKADGWTWNIGIADGDSKKQIDQIENFMTLGVGTLVVVAVDPTGLKDVLTQAKAAGIQIINFTTDPGVGDVYLGADEQLVGQTVAAVASTWIDKAFPNAAPGSVKVAIMEFRDTPEASHRSDGLQTISSNSKVTIVKTVASPNDTAGAQTAAENLMLTNPDLNVILTYNSAMSLGVNAAVMAPASPISDKSKFGTFGADISQEVASDIQASKTDKSVLRGITQIGGDINVVMDNVVKDADALAAGQTVAPRDIAPILKVDASNIDETIQQLYPSPSPS
jgi:ABC-type sugar transport system substrate-binding protein